MNPDDPDVRFMRRALAVAESGRARVAPNPMVGAVVVREGRLVAEGHHAEFGGDHAEVAALRRAGEAARGGTLYVTLEPCDHRGKTGPCTRAILEAGIGRVVYACEDPDPTAGSGGTRLREAGIEVRTNVEAEAARRLNAPFFWRHAREEGGGPFVSLKLALSLDGRLAAEPGSRTRLTGDEADRWVHHLRAGQDAILVGRRTVEADDPLLTPRGDLRPRVMPARIVLDSELRLDPASRLATTAGEAPVWVIGRNGAAAERRVRLWRLGIRVLEVPGGESDGLDLRAVTARLAELGVDALLVEGGGRVATSFLRSGLVQRLHLLYAPLVLGSRGVLAFPDPDVWSPAEWRVMERRELGRDTLILLERADLEGRLISPRDEGR